MRIVFSAFRQFTLMKDASMADEQNVGSKSAEQVLREIEDKELGGKLGGLKKKFEEKIKLRNTQQEALEQTNEEIKDLAAQWDEIQAKRPKKGRGKPHVVENGEE